MSRPRKHIHGRDLADGVAAGAEQGAVARQGVGIAGHVDDLLHLLVRKIVDKSLIKSLSGRVNHYRCLRGFAAKGKGGIYKLCRVTRVAAKEVGVCKSVQGGVFLGAVYAEVVDGNNQREWTWWERLFLLQWAKSLCNVSRTSDY